MNLLNLNDVKIQRFCISSKEQFIQDRMELSFFETFKQMETCARQFLLVQAVHECITFSQSEIADNFDFPDLLRALSEYTSRQERREVDCSSNWRTISQFLQAAVEKLDSNNPHNAIPGTKLFAEQFRRLLMVEFIGIWVKTLEHERYRFSDLLKSLSNYARHQMDLFPENAHVWDVVATLLETAAAEAQRQGDNLP